ncbi:hexosaminidase [Mycetocola sp. BIGb0189]|uniref:family 20 glycosylhydrolase n=1 Tax=Mycetocola sp. BIGb0189 TaxID=2940604 RepID=UPI002167E71B|nr:family 20 glycosylhydrolase [Mycetocola sp. BIGb0189]MCS4275220.1 hexosaminidase [Mycetocola sp. BIGb0189]
MTHTTPSPMVPLPASVHLGDPIALGVTLRIEVAPGLDAVLDTFATLARRTRGVEVEPVAVGIDARIRVELGLDPETTGIAPAAGFDPRPVPADERFTIDTHEGLVLLRSASPEGAFRGLVTILQALDTSGPGLVLPALTIVDGPAFAWRGLSFDTVRHLYPTAEIEAVIDLLAYHRISVLHLHLSDTQGWRLESTAYPRVASVSTAGEREHWTREEFRALITFAAARFITIIPELDLPGHTAAAIAAYPELDTPGTFDHPQVKFLSPENPEAVTFATTVLSELAEISPGPYLHIGGDEAFGMPDEQYADFVRLLHAHVRSLGKRVIGWQEAARAEVFEPSDVLQFWIAEKDAFDADAMRASVPEEYLPLVELAAKTFAHAPGDIGLATGRQTPILVSSSSPLYLDRRHAEGRVDADGTPLAEAPGEPGFPHYAAEPTSGLNDWDPAAHARTALNDARVVGVEAAIWAETIESIDDLAFLLLPRLPLVAERMWRAESREWADTAARLRAQTPVWDALGFGGYYRSAEVFGTAEVSA